MLLLELIYPHLNVTSWRKGGSTKVLFCRSRTCLTQPLPLCTPNVRRWKGLAGCGPQVCHLSGEAAGDVAGARSPGPVPGGSAGSSGPSCVHGFSPGCSSCSSLAVVENAHIPWCLLGPMRA